MPEGLSATEHMPRLDDLVRIGEGAGGIYEYDEITFRVMDAAALPDGYVALTGWTLPERDEDGKVVESMRHMTVFARRAGVTIVQRSTVLAPEPAAR